MARPFPSNSLARAQNISPALVWSGALAGIRSYALIVEDPDAPGGTFTHWLVFDIPGDFTGLKQRASNGSQSGFAQGMNDFDQVGYGGPCPPSGTHHYVFQLFALSQKLGLQTGADKKQLVAAMKGKVLAQTELTGTFGK